MSKEPSRAEPGKVIVEVRMPAWLVLALWMGTTLPASLLILARVTA